MLICPYKDMHHLRELPCQHEHKGNYLYCGKCNTWDKIEQPVDPQPFLEMIFAIIMISLIGWAILFYDNSSNKPKNRSQLRAIEKITVLS